MQTRTFQIYQNDKVISVLSITAKRIDVITADRIEIALEGDDFVSISFPEICNYKEI